MATKAGPLQHRELTAPTSDEMWQDFGQRVDLCARLREVLLSYAEGSTVLKELIQVSCCTEWRASDTGPWVLSYRSVQNADDAGAKVIKLCLDFREHGTGAHTGNCVGSLYDETCGVDSSTLGPCMENPTRDIRVQQPTL